MSNLTKDEILKHNKKENKPARARTTPTSKRPSAGSGTSSLVARYALLASTMTPQLQEALAILVEEISLAKETDWGSITIRFKGKKIAIDTNRKHLIK